MSCRVHAKPGRHKVGADVRYVDSNWACRHGNAGLGDIVNPPRQQCLLGVAAAGNCVEK